MMPKWGALLGAALLSVVALVAGVLVVGPTTGADDAAAADPSAGPAPEAAALAAAADERPNMVFILMDDFSLELLRTMPEATRMAAEGASYQNSFVIDSLCCPSRAALLTGQTPHQTKVLTNTENDPKHPVGGWSAFRRHGNVEKQFSLGLQRAGYTTGFVGKFINAYEVVTGQDGERVPPPKVPGWDSWNALLGGAYGGWGYQSTYLDEHGELKLRHHEQPPTSATTAEKDAAYATNVTRDYALDFISAHKDDEDPYFLEIAAYGPHSRLGHHYPGLKTWFPPAFADQAPADDPTGGNCGRVPCGKLSLKDLVGYGDDRSDNTPTYLGPDGRTSPAPAWRTNKVSLSDETALSQYRDRARMVQSIDRMIDEVRKAVDDNTYIVLTSDNGFHLGQHQLNGGKGAPYDSDTRVPMVVVGPDVVPGERSQFVSNIDLAPTFLDLAGAETPSWTAGTSFAQALTRPKAEGGRYAFFEHTYAKAHPGEVDLDRGSGGTIDIIPSYIAVRSAKGLLVRFDLDNSWKGTDYAYELYRYDRPWEDTNVFAEDHTKPYAEDLMRRLDDYEGCAPAVCRALTR
ncbi:arylsulfatase A-like enzyme [Nocardioides luteus]|uniref:N-acetylglucosamine-6-sulfatase n=1 Tax=Nocardioides luteus TaxID=1844 RepID=A0ABQ5SY17_9ACTN|nr:sulfatase-like hydrolase/transferase [Nocardioides luteus]MDR7309409.1 arylsulfatase A-like enzyme [Nocardioides luteus]GGR51093.1 N-acetylglucosamine-6-sulfatase [Nocardioides luteus]GLJ67816.1 N-acetylglucosamine-6-sulfatase [Nocardioides luteus]